MGDKLRVRRRPRRSSPVSGLSASAKLLRATRTDAPRAEHWHEPAWDFRNTTGELRYAEMWLGASMSRARLVAARRERPGAEPEPLDETHPASELMAELAGGVGGQSALLRGFAPQLLTPGVGYLVGHDPRGELGSWSWQVRSADEIRLAGRLIDGQQTYEVQTGEETSDWVNLGPGGLVVKVYRPHPRRAWLPDSPVGGALDILQELRLLTQSIAATATSRLAGAGILFLPSEIQFEGKWDDWVKEFVLNITQPIKDRGLASAVAPFPVRVPGNFVDKVKHLMFSGAFDEHALRLREELLHRLATAMDMPVRTLTGEQENHWGKAATADEGVKLHTIPNLELVCDGITVGYLRPGLAANGMLGQGVDLPTDERMLVEATQGLQVVDEDGAEIVAWYDLSDFNARPDRGEDAKAAYDRWEAGGDVLRSELGLSEAEAPEGEDFERRVWLSFLEPGGDPQLKMLALRKLGLVTDNDLPAVVTTAPPAPEGGPPERVPEDEGAPAPPEPVPSTSPGDPPPSQEDTPLAAAAAPAPGVVAVIAACDGQVRRALERAGNRLRSRTAAQRRTNPSLDQRPHLMHTACRATAVCPMEQLLEGAWDWVPEIAGQLGQDAASLTASLDAYTRRLITTGTPHSWQLLGHHLADRANGHGPAYRAAVFRDADAVLAATTRAGR